MTGSAGEAAVKIRKEKKTVMKRQLILLLTLVMALSIAACGSTDISTAKEPAEETAGVSETEMPQDSAYYVASVPMYVTLPEGFNAYDPAGNYTEEDCRAQGVEKANMDAYMSMAKKDLMLVPADELYSDLSWEIYIRVKGDKDYGINSFSEVSQEEFEAMADALVQSFEAGGFEVIGGDTYETANARYCVIDCKAIQLERRYVTVVNGKMIYFVAEFSDGMLTDERDAVVRSMLDSVVFR